MGSATNGSLTMWSAYARTRHIISSPIRYAHERPPSGSPWGGTHMSVVNRPECDADVRRGSAGRETSTHVCVQGRVRRHLARVPSRARERGCPRATQVARGILAPERECVYMELEPKRLGFSDLAAHVARRPVAFTANRLLTHFTRNAVERAVSGGLLIRVLPGVYVHRDFRRNPVAVGSALSAWWPRALVTGELALAIHRGEGIVGSRAMVVVQHHVRARAPRWLRVRSAYLDAEAVTVRGVRCTSVAVAVLDAWREAPSRRRQEPVYLALWDRLCTAQELRDAQQAQPRLVDRRRLLALLAHFQDGATSPLEVLAKTEVLVGPDFAGLEWQPPMVIAGRDRAPDALHRSARVAIELDGWKYHGRPAQRERDRLRDNDFNAEGFSTLHFTFEDLVQHADQVRATVRRAIRSGLQRGSA